MTLLKKICNHSYLVEYPYFIEDTNELKIDEGISIHMYSKIVLVKSIDD